MTSCQYCGRDIRPTDHGTWADADDPDNEICRDIDGPEHEPSEEDWVYDEQVGVSYVPDEDGNPYGYASVQAWRDFILSWRDDEDSEEES